MKDQEIIALIKEGKTVKAFEVVYKNFPLIRRMIVAQGGTMDDAKDIFQDSLLVFYRMSLKEDFCLTSSVSTLIYSINKRMWLKKFRDVKSRERELSNESELTDGFNSFEEEAVGDHEKIKLAEKMLYDLGDPCRSLLEKFYYEKQSMKEIAETMGYSNEKTAKAQKYKCIERARKLLGDQLGVLKSLFK